MNEKLNSWHTKTLVNCDTFYILTNLVRINHLLFIPLKCPFARVIVSVCVGVFVISSPLCKENLDNDFNCPHIVESIGEFHATINTQMNRRQEMGHPLHRKETDNKKKPEYNSRPNK